MSYQKQAKTWDDSCAKMTGVHCGRLDMCTYNGETGEPERFVYCDQTDERMKVSGSLCDQVAYMAARYPALQANLKEQAAQIEALRGALREIADMSYDCGGSCGVGCCGCISKAITAADVALEQGGTDSE